MVFGSHFHFHNLFVGPAVVRRHSRRDPNWKTMTVTQMGDGQRSWLMLVNDGQWRSILASNMIKMLLANIAAGGGQTWLLTTGDCKGGLVEPRGSGVY